MLLKRSIKILKKSGFHYRPFSQALSLFDIAEQVFSSDSEESGFVNQVPGVKKCYYEKGCRVVYPYFYVAQAYCLGSWAGKHVNEVYFKDRRQPSKYLWNQYIENGWIRVNKKIVNPDYIMQLDDILSHVFHFHENPIVDLPYRIKHLDDVFIVLDKPPGIPMHPAGNYKYNSLMSMAKQRWQSVYGFNRIDAATSGIVVLVRNQAKANELSNQMANKQITKEYVAEVSGNFPHDEIVVNAPLSRCFKEFGPVIVNFNSGISSSTLIKKVRYKTNTGTSILSCFPITGRSHQIRVHLQYLGFPIMNDPIYNSPAFGPKCGKNGDYGGLSEYEIYRADCLEAKKKVDELLEDSVDVIDEYDNFLPDYRTDRWVEFTHNNRYNPDLDLSCKECRICQSNTKEFIPIRPKKFLHLHALRYKGPDWDFSVRLPYWAR
ncbi:uncharacterized protein C18B11.02c [Tetranychus urticae]|uniref:Pseudouridine synthase n=1 Tax=Tetranychus urticae TaxID=32264 RepID=T1KBB9_TETUR|nr:uncharacterized protein C18B11.02c [Tetranychus urticae]